MTERPKLSAVATLSSTRFDAVALRGSAKESIRAVKRIGFDGVELAVRDPSAIDVDELVRVLDDAQMPVAAIGTGQAYGEEGLSLTDSDPRVRARAAERIHRHVDLSRRIGRPPLIIGLIRGRTQPQMPAGRAHQEMVRSIARCADVAAESGVDLVIEPINRYETDLVNNVESGLALLDEIGRSNVGLLLDTFHMNIEEPSMEESISSAGSRIMHFHAADSNRWAPGAGHISFASVLQALLQTGYQGFVSAEILPYPDGVSAARQAFAELRSVLQKLEAMPE